MLTQIRLTDQQRERLNAEIKAFYLDERGEEIGVIEQMQLLDLFEQKLARSSITEPWMMRKNGSERGWMSWSRIISRCIRMRTRDKMNGDSMRSSKRTRKRWR